MTSVELAMALTKFKMTASTQGSFKKILGKRVYTTKANDINHQSGY